MRITHLSDLHICREHRTYNIAKVNLLLERALEAETDHIVITGDISHLGREQDFEVLRSLLMKYNLMDPYKVSITIGNHDIFGGVHFAEDILSFPGNCRQSNYDERVTRFVEHFSTLFDQTIRIRTTDIFPFAKIIDQYALIGINSIAGYSWLKNPMASNGEISAEQLKDLELLMQDPRLFGKKKILMVHHHFGINGSEPRNFLERIEHHTMKLHNRNRILKLFKILGIDLILHGHLHISNQYSIKGCRFVNGGASVEGDDPSFVNLNIIDLDHDRVSVQVQQIAGPEKPREEIYDAGHYVPSFAG